MRRTKEEAAITREQLLNAALISFSAKGYTRTTLDDIARQAGTTRGAIHWHFGSKAELFNTLVRESFEQASVVFRQSFASKDTPLRTLRQLLVRWLCYVEEDEHFRQVLEILLLKTEIVPELNSGIAEKNQGNAFVKQHFADLLQRSIDAGEVRPDVSPDVAAVAALSIINGISTQWLLDPASFSLASYAETIVDFYIRGISVV